MVERLSRWAAAGGILYVLLAILGNEVLGGAGEAPGVSASHQEMGAYLAANPPTTTVWAGLYIEILGLLFFVFFVARLWSVLRSGEGEPALFSTAALAAGILSVGIKLASLPAGYTTLFRADEGLDPQVAGALIDMNNASFVLTWGIDAVLLAATAVVVLSSGVLPRWAGWSAAVLAMGLLVGMAMPTSEFALPFLLTLIWIVAVSVVMLRGTTTEASGATPVPA